MIKGIHYTLDVRFSANMPSQARELLEVPIVGYGFLLEVTKRIEMLPIMGPFVEKFISPDSQESGISGFIVFAESHASIHTYPERRYLALDIFSCKHFEIDNVIGLLKEVASDQIEKIYLQYLDRGEVVLNQ